MSVTGTAKQVARKAAVVFYALIMLEVIIMISPFALYWYSLYSLGLLGFLVTAAPVYMAKLRRTGVVTSGVYRHIRHRQYLSLGSPAWAR